MWSFSNGVAAFSTTTRVSSGAWPSELPEFRNPPPTCLAHDTALLPISTRLVRSDTHSLLESHASDKWPAFGPRQAHFVYVNHMA